MLKVCLTGATGFIGSNLLAKLQQEENVEVVALSRKISPMMDGATKDGVTWRRCNGFSLLDVEKATEDVDILIYLIHSMLPSSALSQGSFSDFDLYLADNFARAAKKNNVKKIIYLSGLIPQDEKLSKHLESRLEVERVLGQFGNDVTVLRSGLVVGPNGSSFRILEKLVKRLPVLICPSWTMTRTQPIDLQDVLATMIHCTHNYRDLKSRYDIGGPETITYKEMLTETARVLNKKRWIYNVPFFSPGLSKLWVSRITATPHNLVYPLVESLKSEMVADPSHQLLLENHQYTSFSKSLRDSLELGMKKAQGKHVRSVINYNASINFRWLENVTSIQRVNYITQNVDKVAIEYFRWLPRFLKPIITVTEVNDRIRFRLLGFITLLVLEKCEDRSDVSRVFYYIRDGFLARETTLNGRLEFRYIEGAQCILMSLLDYRPSLPWFIYKYTQAVAHLFVMKQFDRHLRNKDK
jgi:uncharacterized protein YbjT (DUF2867 family)